MVAPPLGESAGSLDDMLLYESATASLSTPSTLSALARVATCGSEWCKSKKSQAEVEWIEHGRGTDELKGAEEGLKGAEGS